MDIKELDKNHILQNYARLPLELVSGAGAIVTDKDGNDYIDFTAGIGVTSLGHANKKITKAICAQSKKLIHASNLFYNECGANLAKQLCDVTGYDKAFFCNSGTEAVEAVIKTMRKAGAEREGKPYKIVVLEGSFHGRTLGALSATMQDVMQNGFFPLLDGFVKIPPDDTKKLESAMADPLVVGLLVELVMGEGGVRPLTKQFVKRAGELCKVHNKIFAVDEVQTGVGRTGRFLCAENYNVTPNLVSIAKGLGGGVPIGAVLFDKSLSSVLTAGTHGTTFGGNPLVTAVAGAVVSEIANPKFLARVRSKSTRLRKQLQKIFGAKAVHGVGFMIGIDVGGVEKAKAIQAECIKQGLLVLLAKDRIRLLPPLNVNQKEIDAACGILDGVSRGRGN